ncbi:MAG: hypothetical protein Q9M91_06945 [Candidatus Dojkabacteria bacterium]|nr:hypothetical protein [Candidatus Dojkabacteria bacterium]MDQ7021530.1 hypothetical protein [Candidatus Dojkabacteria bacterium]
MRNRPSILFGIIPAFTFLLSGAIIDFTGNKGITVVLGTYLFITGFSIWRLTTEANTNHNNIEDLEEF